MDKRPGTYTLVLRAKSSFSLDIGQLGRLQGQPGYYLYCGSAFGSGGLAARLKHHRQITERPHWHIDYLRKTLALSYIWYSYDPVKREHDWARVLSSQSAASCPQPGFGASDCQCLSHLIYLKPKPSLADFQHNLALCLADYNRGFPVFEIQ